MWQEQISSCTVNPIQVTNVQLVRKLLEVKIPDDSIKNANMKDGLDIEIIGSKPFIVNAYWVVKVQDLHKEIEKDWLIMRQLLTNGQFLAGSNTHKACLSTSEPQLFDKLNESLMVKLKPPKPIDTSTMTVTPRDFYPIVVIVSCNEEEDSDVRANDIAANIHIIHIKDDIVPIRNHVIKNYTKQVDGSILDISQLYPEESLACMICYEDADIEQGIRLFCLLPCRHSPVCSNCIRRIRECPKCRNFIQTVFDINAPSSQISNPHDDVEKPQTSSETVEQPTSQLRRRPVGFMNSIKNFLHI